jgi:two-component system nitrate/nitrite response regulator NarL
VWTIGQCTTADTPSFEATTLLVVAWSRLFREGVTELLRREERVRVVGVAASVSEAFAACEKLLPRLVLIDANLPDADLLGRRICSAAASSVVAFGLDESDVRIMEWAELGARGFVDQWASAAQLVEVLCGVCRDELVCSPRLAGRLLRRVANTGASTLAPPRRPLTSRELEVLGLLERGLSNKEIAVALSVELATVKHHVHNVLDKLDARGRGQAVARSRSLGAIGAPI